LLLALGSLATICQAGEYQATAEFRSARAGGMVRMPVTVVIRREASHEQLLQLREALERGGQTALLTALDARADGALQLGAVQHRLNLVASRTTSRGRTVVVVTVRRLQIEEINQGSDSLDYPFGVAVLELDGMGRGEGLFYPAAALRVGSDGAVVVDSFTTEPGRLIHVREQR